MKHKFIIINKKSIPSHKKIFSKIHSTHVFNKNKYHSQNSHEYNFYVNKFNVESEM